MLIVIKLSTLPWLFISSKDLTFLRSLTTPPSPPPFFPVSVGVKLAIYFLVFSLQNVEVFYWCGEKQWGQGRALWWQKCIFNPCEWMAPHIPQQQALYWMAALTRLFSLLITALCLFTMDIVIYLYQLRGGVQQYKDSIIGDFFWYYHWAAYGTNLCFSFSFISLYKINIKAAIVKKIY